MERSSSHQSRWCFNIHYRFVCCCFVSDKVITQKCNLLDICKTGDAIMVDKGFLISDLTYVSYNPLKNKSTNCHAERLRKLGSLLTYTYMLSVKWNECIRIYNSNIYKNQQTYESNRNVLLVDNLFKSYCIFMTTD